MKSTITSKFQTTIPKAIRKALKLSIKDALEWELSESKAMVYVAQKKFLKHKNSIKIGEGNIIDDITQARKLRGEKHR